MKLSLNNVTIFKCKYCGTRFKSETNYLKHKCERMIREEKLRTSLGQSAWNFYKEWFRLKKKQVFSHTSFLESKYYKAFNNFAAFVKKTSMPSPTTFMKLMIEKDIYPHFWLRDEFYAIYLNYIDNIQPPVKQADTTIDTLYELSQIFDCKMNEVFNHLHPNEVADLLRYRRISPWLLLNGSVFYDFLRNLREKNIEQFNVIMTFIPTKEWKKRFADNPKYKEIMIKLAKEAGL